MLIGNFAKTSHDLEILHEFMQIRPEAKYIHKGNKVQKVFRISKNEKQTCS